MRTSTILMTSVSWLVLADTAQAAQTASVEEIVVTGSRIVRDGYEAPTPVTVMPVEDLKAAAPTTLSTSSRSSQAPSRCRVFSTAQSEIRRTPETTWP
jgi:hypothetical protein